MDRDPDRDMDERVSIDMDFDDALGALLSEDDEDTEPDEDE
jgi:hypothetical protein